jgi:hypothetical protein
VIDRSSARAQLDPATMQLAKDAVVARGAAVMLIAHPAPQ